MVGRWRDHNDVVEHGLRPIVMKVQQLDGYRSYAAYKAAMESLITLIQTSVSYEMALKNEVGNRNAADLIRTCVELSSRLKSTELCESMANPCWEAQRMFILEVNKWSGGAADAATEDFAKKAKLLTVFQRIAKSQRSDDQESGLDPFAKGGIFDKNPGNANKKRPHRDAETRTCHLCSKAGHIARNCPTKSKRDVSTITCRRCKEKGHLAADCDGVKK